MSYFGGMEGLATGPGSALRFATTRGRIQGSPAQGMNYPNPFFDIAHTYLPVTIKAMFRWCRFYFLTNPIINAMVFKLSEYPVTDVIIEHENPEVVRRWTEYFHEHLRYRSFQVETGLDYNVYGNSFPALSYEMVKWLKCRTCGFSEKALHCKNSWIFTNNEFRLTCPKCGNVGDADVQQQYLKNPSGVRLIRWNAEDLEVDYNPISGRYTYFYTIPPTIRNDITVGRKDLVADIPQIFIQAIKENKGIVFSPDKLFHLKRPSLATIDRGWGIPLLLPLLKDCFYLQVMKKSQEAVLLEHIIPLRCIFPQAATGASDPFLSINLVDWREHVANEIARWRMDCVTPQTMIETRDGLRSADTVAAGDELKNHLGGFSVVEKVWRRSLRDGERAYRVVARGLSAIDSVFSEGHPFLAARKFNNGNGHKLGSPEFIRVKDLRVGDYVGYPVTRKIFTVQALDLKEWTDRACTDLWTYVDHVCPDVPEAFEYLADNNPTDRQVLLNEKGWGLNAYKIAQIAHREGRTLRRLPRYLPFDEELAWAVGLYLAEGSTSNKQVMIAAHDEEVKTIERVRKFFLDRFGANCTVARQSKHGVQLYFSSVVAAQLFSTLCPGDARTKRIPSVYLHAEDALVSQLLSGLVSGDGCWHEDGYSDKVSYVSASRQLAADYRWLCMSLHVPVNVSYEGPYKYNILGKIGMSHGAYRVTACGPAKERLRRLFKWLDTEPIESTNSGVFRDGCFWSRIKRIEQVEAAEVIGFRMGGDVKVLLSDDTESHGTFCTWGMAGANSNHIPILPLPVGQQTIGGDGKALLLTGEIQQMHELLCAGGGVPREFIFGGLSFSGSSVSMRMLENAFIGYIMRQKQLAQWVMQEAASFLDWPIAKIRPKPFKMADDLQRKAFLLQVNQAGKLSDTSLLAECDYDQREENKIMESETDERSSATKKQQLATAKMQGEAQLVMASYQVKAQQLQQQAMQAPVAPGEPGGLETQQAGGSPGGEQVEPQQAVGQQPAGGQQPQQTPQPAVPGPSGGGMPQNDVMVQMGVNSPLNAGQNMQQQGQGVGVDLTGMAMFQAKLIAKLPPEQQQLAIQNLATQSPELAQMVQAFVKQMSGNGGAAQPVDMRGPPAVLPPRRLNGSGG